MQYDKKLINLRKRQHDYRENTNTQFQKNVVNNFLMYNLSKAFGLDQHIPPNIVINSIETKFEYFYQNILNDILSIPQHHLNNNKRKLGSTCEKYCNTKTPCKYQKVMKQLSMNKAIVIMEQDEKWGEVWWTDHNILKRVYQFC